MQNTGEPLTDENASYHSVVSSSPAHIQPLQYVLRQVDVLLSHILPDVQAIAELARRSRPVFISEAGVAPVEQVTQHLCHNLLEGAKQWREYTIAPPKCRHRVKTERFHAFIFILFF